MIQCDFYHRTDVNNEDAGNSILVHIPFQYIKLPFSLKLERNTREKVDRFNVQLNEGILTYNFINYQSILE